MTSKKPPITEEEKITAEEQIRALRKEIDYNTRDYSIDFLIQQFRNDEFYIPDEYQRQYIWNNADKNRFIESILLGLPIPLMRFPSMMWLQTSIYQREVPTSLLCARAMRITPASSTRCSLVPMSRNTSPM